MDVPRCDVIVPCRDEAAALPLVLADVPSDWRIIVVDNGSVDGTAEVATSLGAHVVIEPTPGYGSAVHSGVLASSAEWIAIMDGDASMRMSDLERLVTSAIQDPSVTMVIGRRRPVSRSVWPWHARLGNIVLSWWIRRASAFAIHDLAPMRVCRRSDLLALGVEDRRFGYPLELMLRASRAGWTVRELDIDYLPRAAGTRSKVSGSVRGTAQVMKDFAKVLA